MLTNKDILSMKELSKDEVELILETANELEPRRKHDVLAGKIMASLFFQRSTRTRLSFETAMLRLGGGVVGFAGAESSRAGDPMYAETLEDTIRVVSGYADAIVMRHPVDGAAKEAAGISDVPVINGGDGDNEHPTQALLDLYTMKREMGNLDGLNVALVGNLRYMRCMHSLAYGLAKYNVKLYLLSPERYAMPTEITDHLKKEGVRHEIHSSPEDVISEIDVLYVDTLLHEHLARLPSEEKEYYLQYDESYRFGLDKLSKGKSNLIVMHPLPRTDEMGYQIRREVDTSQYAKYFEESANGIRVRMALLKLVLENVW